MKKIPLILILFTLLTSCATPKVRYVRDEYSQGQSYLKITGVKVGGFKKSVIIDFRTKSGTDDVIALVETKYDKVKTVTEFDNIVLMFDEGEDLVLNYITMESQYEGGDYSYLRAYSDVIENFGELKMVRVNTPSTFYNIKPSKSEIANLAKLFDLIQNEAKNEFAN